MKYKCPIFCFTSKPFVVSVVFQQALFYILGCPDIVSVYGLRIYNVSKKYGYFLCYLTIKDQETSKSAWSSLLNRTPRYLNWGQEFIDIDLESIYQFDISDKSIERRNTYAKNNIF